VNWYWDAWDLEPQLGSKFLAQGNNSNNKVATTGIEPETLRVPGQCPNHLAILHHTRTYTHTQTKKQTFLTILKV